MFAKRLMKRLFASAVAGPHLLVMGLEIATSNPRKKKDPDVRKRWTITHMQTHQKTFLAALKTAIVGKKHTSLEAFVAIRGPGTSSSEMSSDYYNHPDHHHHHHPNVTTEDHRVSHENDETRPRAYYPMTSTLVLHYRPDSNTVYRSFGAVASCHVLRYRTLLQES